jgi:hypothetical protein
MVVTGVAIVMVVVGVIVVIMIVIMIVVMIVIMIVVMIVVMITRFGGRRGHAGCLGLAASQPDGVDADDDSRQQGSQESFHDVWRRLEIGMGSG